MPTWDSDAIDMEKECRASYQVPLVPCPIYDGDFKNKSAAPLAYRILVFQSVLSLQ